jgi:hypothetical protein
VDLAQISTVFDRVTGNCLWKKNVFAQYTVDSDLDLFICFEP